MANQNTIMKPISLPEDYIENRTYGFWLYLMSDCVLFAVLFAVYAVLHNNYAGGPGPKELFELKSVLAETLCLLTSTLTCALMIYAVHRDKKNQALFWLFLTFALGGAFISLEIKEFYHLISEGNTPSRSAFLSSFFTLVGTHGAHVTMGLLWITVMMAQVFVKELRITVKIRLFLFSLYWHFLDIIWICIFTLVYLLGTVQ